MAAAATTNQDAFVIPDELFTFDTDYRRWAAVMRENLKWHDLWDVIEKCDRYSPELRKEKEALDALKMSCGAEILPHVMYADFSGDVWRALEWFGTLGEEGRVGATIKEYFTRRLVETVATARAIADDFPEVDKILTRRNYGKWKIYMKNVLLSRYLWALVDDEERYYGPDDELFFKRRNQTALFIIKMSCGKEMTSLHMEGEEDAANAWRRLKNELDDDEAAPAERIKDIVAAHQLLTVMNWTLGQRDGVNNYPIWVFRMKDYLITQGLWGFEEEDHIIDHVKDEKALDVIKASCAPETLDYILYIDCAKNAWKELARVGGIDLDDCLEDHPHTIHCDRVQDGEIARENLSKHSEADRILTRGSNFEKWEAYVTDFLKSRSLYHELVYNIQPATRIANFDTKNAYAIRFIKVACGRDMMPHIFRITSPGEGLTILRKASMDKKDEYMKYSRLLHAVQKNGFEEEMKDRNGEFWYGAHKFFRDFPEALTDEITADGSTALHVAVKLGRVDFVKRLLPVMSIHQTRMKLPQGDTAIAVAAAANNMEMVAMLVESDPQLLLARNEHELNAVAIAAINGNEEIMRYLYPKTNKRTFHKWSTRSVASLLTSAVRLGAFDIVWDLLRRFPSDYVLGKDAYGMTLLSVLAEKPSAFPSGNQFGYFGGWIYQLAESKTHETLLEALKLIVFPVESLVEPVDPPAEPVDPDLVALPVRLPLRFLKHHCKAGSKAHKTLLKALKLTGVKEVIDCKVKHDLVALIIQHMCSLLPNLNPHQLEESLIYDAMHRSINNGIIELFENLIDANPYLEHYKDENGRGWFQIAIMARQESIFQYIYGMGPRNQGMTLPDKFGNNALHCAALWNPTPQLDKVHGPALQAQRELQWFQEVERIVPPRYALMKNNKENGTANDETHKTPGELFTLQHKGLAKEGEKWMKDTAQACMLVTTLIATVMFAAAFTLPGGSDQNTGVPLKANTTAFKVFIISDAISLFSSCTSVLMFFAILTSRYAERDFLTSLPKKMILGLSTLFISIATMMATFAATLVIVLRGQASWAYIPVTILASIPVVLFGLLQLPLFINILKSTYGRGIFHRKTRIVFAPLTSINVKY